MTKEKYQVYVQREANFYSQLKIAKEKVKAGSMSEKDYINFNNSYLESKLAKTNVETKLIDLEKMLDTMLAIVELAKEGAAFWHLFRPFAWCQGDRFGFWIRAIRTWSFKV